MAGQGGAHREEFPNKRQRKLAVILYDFVTDSMHILHIKYIDVRWGTGHHLSSERSQILTAN